MQHPKSFQKNIGFLLLILFLWAMTRYLHVLLLHAAIDGFQLYDMGFLLLPALAAFFMNWHWMREQHRDTIRKWSLGWATADLLVMVVAVMLLRDPVCWVVAQLK